MDMPLEEVRYGNVTVRYGAVDQPTGPVRVTEIGPQGVRVIGTYPTLEEARAAYRQHAGPQLKLSPAPRR